MMMNRTDSRREDVVVVAIVAMHLLVRGRGQDWTVMTINRTDSRRELEVPVDSMHHLYEFVLKIDCLIFMVGVI